MEQTECIVLSTQLLHRELYIHFHLALFRVRLHVLAFYRYENLLLAGHFFQDREGNLVGEVQVVEEYLAVLFLVRAVVRFQQELLQLLLNSQENNQAV